MFKLLLNDFDAAQPLGKFFVYLALALTLAQVSDCDP